MAEEQAPLNTSPFPSPSIARTCLTTSAKHPGHQANQDLEHACIFHISRMQGAATHVHCVVRAYYSLSSSAQRGQSLYTICSPGMQPDHHIALVQARLCAGQYFLSSHLISSHCCHLLPHPSSCVRISESEGKYECPARG